MAALTRAKAAGWSRYEQLTSTQADTMDSNGAAGVARASTAGGAKAVSTTYVGTQLGYTAAVVAPGADMSWIFRASGSSGAAGTAIFALVGLPHGHTLNSVTAKFVAAAHTALPTTLPKIVLKRRYYGAATGGVALGSADFAGTVGTYDATAGFSLSATGGATAVRTIDLENYEYWVTIRNESGTGSKGSLALWGIQANVTVDTASGGADFTFWK